MQNHKAPDREPSIASPSDLHTTKSAGPRMRNNKAL